MRDDRNQGTAGEDVDTTGGIERRPTDEGASRPDELDAVSLDPAAETSNADDIEIVGDAPGVADTAGAEGTDDVDGAVVVCGTADDTTAAGNDPESDAPAETGPPSKVRRLGQLKIDTRKLKAAWRANSLGRIALMAVCGYVLCVGAAYFFVKQPLSTDLHRMKEQKNILHDYVVIEEASAAISSFKEGLMTGDQRLTVMSEVNQMADESGVKIVGDPDLLLSREISPNLVDTPSGSESGARSTRWASSCLFSRAHLDSLSLKRSRSDQKWTAGIVTARPRCFSRSLHGRNRVLGLTLPPQMTSYVAKLRDNAKLIAATASAITAMTAAVVTFASGSGGVDQLHAEDNVKWDGPVGLLDSDYQHLVTIGKIGRASTNGYYVVADVRDPMVAPKGALKAAPSAHNEDTVKAPAPTTLPNMWLSGIIWDPENPIVMIDGLDLRVGDTIKGAKVVEIRMDSVVLSFASKEFCTDRRLGGTE